MLVFHKLCRIAEEGGESFRGLTVALGFTYLFYGP